MLNKNYIHDIKPSSRTQKRRQAFHRAHEKRIRELEDNFGPEAPSYVEDRSGGRGIWYVAALVLLILFFALTFVFSGATVFVTPRTGTVELSGPILAEKQSTDGLSFEMSVLEGEKSISVTAGEKTYVEKKAVGRVRLFNNNPAVQKLLIDTRLESSDGYIYKTKIATAIPAQKTENGKKVPGYVDVDVYADEPGDVYNIEKDSSLKVVGFRGSPKYETVYAKTLTAISGGFKGESYEVGEETLTAKTQELKESLTSELVANAIAELPKDFIMYDSLVLPEFEDVVISEGESEGEAKISVKGKLNAVIFKESELTKALVEKVITNTEENKVSIINLRDLNLMLEEGFSVSNPQTITDLKVIIEDKIQVRWDVNEEEVKEHLAGIKKRDFQNKMLEFKNIDKAELSLKPFWKSSLPEKVNSIKIVNTSKEQK